MVRFIFYATKPELFSQELSHIKRLLLSYDTETILITDRTQLVCLMPQLDRKDSVVLLFASTDEELDDLVQIKQHFGAIPSILILPDDNTSALQRGMLLHPLYFMSKHAELNQYSLAVDELCRIYSDINQSSYQVPIPRQSASA